MSYNHAPSDSYNSSSMEHMEAEFDPTFWSHQTHFDNAMYPPQDPSQSLMLLAQQHFGHDDCLRCDSPDCGEPPCPETFYPCYDPNCLADPTSSICTDPHAEQCAGAAPSDVLNGAHLLSTLNGGMMDLDHPGHSTYCNPQSHLGGEMQGFMTQSNYVPNNAVHGHNHEHLNFNADEFLAQCDGRNCSFDQNWNSGFEGFHGCDHFQNIEDVNVYHNFWHHIQATEGTCPTAPQPSPITQSTSDAPSEAGLFTPRRVHSTPATGSSTSSPLPTSRDVSQKTVNPQHYEEPDPEDLVCKWLVEDGQCCNMQFHNQKELQDHTCQAHISSLTKAKGFFCKWEGCARLEAANEVAFAQKSKLERHMQKHTGHKSEICKECGNRYATAQTLAQHMKTHQDTKPEKCTHPGCTYSTAQASQLTMHMRTMHLSQKPLKCPYCDQYFSESSNLSKHKKTHKEPGEFYCGACNKKFARDDQVTRHWKKHLKDESAAIEKEKEKRLNQGIPQDVVDAASVFDLLGRPAITKKAVILSNPRTSPTMLTKGLNRTPAERRSKAGQQGLKERTDEIGESSPVVALSSMPSQVDGGLANSEIETESESGAVRNSALHSEESLLVLGPNKQLVKTQSDFHHIMKGYPMPQQMQGFTPQMHSQLHYTQAI